MQPLKIPTKKWVHVTTDLVMDLPESDGYTAIAVFVNKLTKIVHFAPCQKEVDAMEYARIFVDTVFRLHGLPKVIISDHDPHFTGKFWESLSDLLGMDLRFNIAYRPQTNGQSERMIQTLLEPICREEPLDLKSATSISGVCSKQCCQCGDGTHTFLLTIWRPPRCIFSLDVRRGWFDLN